jgi:hypothetical protein
LQATFEFFDADRAPPSCCSATPTGRTTASTSGWPAYERFISDIETLIVAVQQRGDVVPTPSRLVAYTLTVLIGEIAHRRLTTDDGITAPRPPTSLSRSSCRDCARTTGAVR